MLVVVVINVASVARAISVTSCTVIHHVALVVVFGNCPPDLQPVQRPRIGHQRRVNLCRRPKVHKCTPHLLRMYHADRAGHDADSGDEALQVALSELRVEVADADLEVLIDSAFAHFLIFFLLRLLLRVCSLSLCGMMFCRGNCRQKRPKKRKRETCPPHICLVPPTNL